MVESQPTGVDPRPSGLTGTAYRQAEVFAAVLKLETWLDSMRQTDGYGGPVVHWWEDSLGYAGPGLDWRYEGIIIGYLNLWSATQETVWLEKARRAGDDLLRGQLPSGNFRNSQFELNPGTGGTPHEAACDLALIRLASALKADGQADWRNYLVAAECNLSEFYFGRLWDPECSNLRDHPRMNSFVPNKAATLVEALFAYTALTVNDLWIAVYALPIVEQILLHQISSGDLAGAIYQNSFGERKIAKFFPLYIARCLPALLEAWSWTGEERYASAARSAAKFILRWQNSNGSFAQVIYPNGHKNQYPQWIAATGDILRTLSLARQVGIEFDETKSIDWLLAGQKDDGAIKTAFGFGKVTPGGKANDPRDEVGVCGWADKAFRYLTCILPLYDNGAHDQ